MSDRRAVATVHGPLKVEPPHAGHLAYGVILPALVIVVELSTRLCAQAFFDPLPTWWHVAAVALVPIANLAILVLLTEGRHAVRPWHLALNGAAIGVAAFYTLLFLPLMPIALVAVLVVVGLLPFAPLGGLVAAWQLGRRLAAHGHPVLLASRGVSRAGFRRAYWAGLAAALVLLVGLDLRAALTRLGAEMAQSVQAETRARGLALLRTVGDEELLLRFCYDAAGRAHGPLSLLLGVTAASRRAALDTARAREVFYRVTGEPFNARPVPSSGPQHAIIDDMTRDPDQGGTSVAGRVRGLSLIGSRLDGSVAGDDAVAYLEWTLEFENRSPQLREARVEIGLPPGAVVSRATLWVNGEEREAAFASRAAARKAYETVVRRMQDPLLVTTKGADRVLAQAFPLPANGGTIKFRLGITAPLELTAATEARLVLPAILDRNFSISGDAPHAVWLEGRQALAGQAGQLEATSDGDGVHRLAGTLSDAALSGARTSIRVARDAQAVARLSRIGERPAVVQRIAPERPAAAELTIVVDASRPMRPHLAAIEAALSRIAAGRSVGLLVAGDELRQVPAAAWGPQQARAFREVLAAEAYAGGVDSTDALVAALKAVAGKPGGHLLWVHGPQPVRFRDSRARLEQAAQRIGRPVAVTLYGVAAGPNQLLPDEPWAWAARGEPNTGDVTGDLARLLDRLLGGGERLVVTRSAGSGEADDMAGLARGSEHIARLWASETILAEALRNPRGDRTAAVALAADYQLVTPVSGAVVLETARQYQEAGLAPVASGTVPTVPEPHEWALILIALATLAWMARQQGLVGARRRP